MGCSIGIRKLNGRITATRLAVLGIAVLSVSGAQTAGPARRLADLPAGDLQERVVEALTSRRAQGPSPELRSKLEVSLNLDRIIDQTGVGAQLYLPPLGGDHPALIIVDPHSDKSRLTQEVLPATLAHLGFVTIVVDVFADHTQLNRLMAGVTPQTLMQAHIRSALAYLRSRSDVDPARIGLVAYGLAGTIAAILNPELAALVLSHSAPDLQEELTVLRKTGPEGVVDGCLIVHGLLQFVEPVSLLRGASSRHLLLFESRAQVLADVREEYSSRGARSNLMEREETYGSTEWRREVYRWLMSQLMPNGSWDGVEFVGTANVTNGTLPVALSPQPTQAAQISPVTPALLESLLGAPLPLAPKGFGIQRVAPIQDAIATTQVGIDVPVTVLRPGPEGGDPENGIVVAWADSGRDSLRDDPFLMEVVKWKWMVWIVDPRGIGELDARADAFVFTASALLGENFAWRQASDVARIAEIASNYIRPHRVGLYASGNLAGLIAGYAVNVGGTPRPEWIVVKPGPLTQENVSRLPPYAVPFASESVFDPTQLFRVVPDNSLSFGDPPRDFNWR